MTQKDTSFFSVVEMEMFPSQWTEDENSRGQKEEATNEGNCFFYTFIFFKVVLRSRRGGFGPLHAHILSGIPSGKVR